MADPGSKGSSWPAYDSGPAEHMHPLGIVAVNYNLFENSLYRLFAHHLRQAGLTDQECSYLFGSYDNARRIGSMCRFFDEREKDEHIKHLVSFLAVYWNVVSEKRHLLMHSLLAQRTMLEALLGIDEPDPVTLRLWKHSKDDWAAVNVLKLSLPNLRAIADELHAGFEFARNLADHLQWRDGKLSGLALGHSIRPTLPEKPRMPRKLKLRPRPLNPRDEPHPR